MDFSLFTLATYTTRVQNEKNNYIRLFMFKTNLVHIWGIYYKNNYEEKEVRKISEHP